MTTEKEPKKKPREWTCEPFTVMTKGEDGFEYPVEKIVVTFRDKRWELPNTTDGRNEALRRVNAIRERESVMKTLSVCANRMQTVGGEIKAKNLADADSGLMAEKLGDAIVRMVAVSETLKALQ